MHPRPWLAIAAACCLAAAPAFAGKQQYEPLTASVRSALAAAVADDRSPPEPRFVSVSEKVDWLATMSDRLPRKWKPDYRQRMDFLHTVRYEAQRAGLDPHLVLGLIEVESYFRRYAVSSAGARGYMQVMPFWTDVIGDGDASRLFDMRSNLRYGCTILRHYIDIERGDLFRALGRYNGSLGKPEYPNAVLRAWKKWEYRLGPGATTVVDGSSGGAGATPAAARSSVQAANVVAPVPTSVSAPAGAQAAPAAPAARVSAPAPAPVTSSLPARSPT
jgi:soluble lytic murein transglycosylase-like protein